MFDSPPTSEIGPRFRHRLRCADRPRVITSSHLTLPVQSRFSSPLASILDQSPSKRVDLAAKLVGVSKRRAKLLGLREAHGVAVCVSYVVAHALDRL